MRIVQICILLFVLVFTGSCVNKYQGRQLSAFTINAQNKNSKIVDRVPDYGDGRKDGCIIMSEMKVDLDLRQQGIIAGAVSDVTDHEPLNGASVSILTKSGKTVNLMTDNQGKFLLNLDEDVARLNVSYVSYRMFIAEM